MIGPSQQPLPGQGSDLHIVPLDGQPSRSLGVREFNLHDVRAHPDGKRVVFVAGGSVAEFWSASGLR